MVTNLFSLEGKVVVITGGHGYFGLAMAEGLLHHGASVVLADIVSRSGAELTIDGKSFDRLHSIACDVSDSESIRMMFRETASRLGKVDVLINNAYYGAGYGADGSVERMTDEVWLKGLDGAVGTAFRCTREAVPYFEESDGGSIVNIASMYGMVSPDPRIYGDSGANNPANYGAGKAAVLQLTRYCAGNLAHKKVRVNSITPGPFPHPGLQSANPAFVKALSDRTMLGRVGSRHELTGAVVLLSSDASSYITGANIVVDGGWTAW